MREYEYWKPKHFDSVDALENHFISGMSNDIEAAEPSVPGIPRSFILAARIALMRELFENGDPRSFRWSLNLNQSGDSMTGVSIEVAKAKAIVGCFTSRDHVHTNPRASPVCIAHSAVG
jgi:hypothetical protein